MSKNIIQIVETAWTVERTYSIRQLQFEDAPCTTFFEDVVHVILEILLTGDPVVVRNGYRHPIVLTEIVIMTDSLMWSSILRESRMV